jgi:hypothetical protein
MIHGLDGTLPTMIHGCKDLAIWVICAHGQSIKLMDAPW